MQNYFRFSTAVESNQGMIAPKLIYMYRHIQLLGNLCNEIQQKSLLSVILVTASIVLAFCMAMLVILPFNSENILTQYLLMIASIDAMLFHLFCFGGMVTVHNMSTVTFRKLRKKTHAGLTSDERRSLRKFVRSCNPIRIKFGANNFVEKLTPLKCLHCCVRVAVQIVLLHRKGSS